MAVCPNCGSQVDGRFCAKCGTAVNVAGGAAAGPAPAPQAAAPGTTTATTAPGGLSDNLAAALCYIPLPMIGLVVAILFLMLAPYNQSRNVRFHAFQSIFLHVAAFVVLAAWQFVALISGTLLGFLTPLIWLGCFVLWLVMMLKAYQNQKIVLPVIGPLAEQQVGG